jgi:iron(III) transport system substrate-binding protein
MRVAKTILAAALTWAGLSLAASAQAPQSDAALYEAAKKDGTVVWYVGAPLEGMNAIAAQFEKLHPGIKIQLMRMVGVAQYQRFMDETGAKKYIADVLQNTDYPSMASLVEDGHIAEWKIPTSDRMPAEFRIGNYAYAQYTSTNAIVYNVNKVTPEEVRMMMEKGWEAVLDPRFKGRFSVSPMKCGVCYAPIHMFMDPKFKDRYGAEFLKKIAAQNPASYSEVLVALDRVVAGEQDFTISGWEASAATKWIDGAPIRWVFPKPTPIFGNSWLGVSAYAPHPNAARYFLSWLMSDEGQEVMQKVYGSQGTLRGIADDRPYTKESWYKAPVELYQVDWKRWDANYHKDMDLWAATLKAAK